MTEEAKLTKTEKLNTVKVTTSNAISKFGDVLFDYVNTVFLSSIPNGQLGPLRPCKGFFCVEI